MRNFDALCIALAVALVPPTIIVGGLFHPNTLAGAVARFVFSTGD